MTQDHFYDCAMCGAPCKLSGHPLCPKAGGTCVRVVPCWKHGIKRVTLTEPVVRTVAVERALRPVAKGWVPGRLLQSFRKAEPKREPYKFTSEPLKNVVKVDDEFSALIDSEQAKVADAIRERNEKGDV
jgi:hypothetical protein